MFFRAHLCKFAWWASMHHFLSVCLSVWVCETYVVHYLNGTAILKQKPVLRLSLYTIAPSIYLSMYFTCAYLQVGSMSTSSCVFCTFLFQLRMCDSIIWFQIMHTR